MGDKPQFTDVEVMNYRFPKKQVKALFHLYKGWVRYKLNLLGRVPCHTYRNWILRHIYLMKMDKKVVLYGGDISGTARVAYAYIWAGVEDVKIVNGGIDAWKKAGYETEKKTNKGTEAKDFGTTVPAHPEYWTSIEDAKDKVANDDNFKLVSIRSEEEWLGKTSGYNYMDKAGEPDGAVWGKGAKTAADVADFTNDDGTVKNLDGFKEVWKDCDFTLDNHLAFYCGTGWRATVPFLVLYENG